VAHKPCDSPVNKQCPRLRASDRQPLLPHFLVAAQLLRRTFEYDRAVAHYAHAIRNVQRNGEYDIHVVLDHVSNLTSSNLRPFSTAALAASAHIQTKVRRPGSRDRRHSGSRHAERLVIHLSYIESVIQYFSSYTGFGIFALFATGLTCHGGRPVTRMTGPT
jgi:lipopolysaccharide biosynthesis protein